MVPEGRTEIRDSRAQPMKPLDTSESADVSKACLELNAQRAADMAAGLGQQRQHRVLWRAIDKVGVVEPALVGDIEDARRKADAGCDLPAAGQVEHGAARRREQRISAFLDQSPLGPRGGSDEADFPVGHGCIADGCNRLGRADAGQRAIGGSVLASRPFGGQFEVEAVAKLLSSPQLGALDLDPVTVDRLKKQHAGDRVEAHQCTGVDEILEAVAEYGQVQHRAGGSVTDAGLQRVAALRFQIWIGYGSDAELRDVQSDVDVLERRRAEAPSKLEEDIQRVDYWPDQSDARCPGGRLQIDDLGVRKCCGEQRVGLAVELVVFEARARAERRAALPQQDLVEQVDPGFGDFGAWEVAQRESLAQHGGRQLAGLQVGLGGEALLFQIALYGLEAVADSVAKAGEA